MTRSSTGTSSLARTVLRNTAPTVAFVALAIALAGATRLHEYRSSASGEWSGAHSDTTLMDQVLLGRSLVLNHDCAGCHGGEYPSGSGWLAGQSAPEAAFLIGPCATKLDAKPCFHTHARNLTPDPTTGLGNFSERQIFNALRYGLRPGETPDVEITSTTPGVGNFPEHPKYLAPPMPWPSWRYMSDTELRAIAAYLKHGVKPVHNRIPDSEGPPDFWASTYTVAAIGPYPPAPFPTQNEQMPQK